MKKYQTIKCILIFQTVLCIVSCSEITQGIISVKGNEPHTYCALVTKDHKEYKIIGKYKKEIQDKYQGKRLSIKGKIMSRPLGPGFPAELMVEKIIQIE